MAFRRRYGRKRTLKKRRRIRKKSYTRPRVYKSLTSRNGIHFFKRSAYLGTCSVTINAAGFKGGVLLASGIKYMNVPFTSPTVANMPSYTEFTALFDKYKLLGYKLQLIPRFDSATTANPTSNGYAANVHWVHDVDDAGSPVDMDSLMQYPGCKRALLSGRKGVTIYCKYPSVATAVYNGVTTAYSPKRSPWIDMTYDDTPHYGVKVAFTGNPTAEIYFEAQVTWYFACKDVR